MPNLLEFLRKRKDDRGIMAALRCGLVENKKTRAWPVLAALGGIGDSPAERAVRTVAGLYALHPLESDQGNLGTVCRLLCTDAEIPWKDDKPGPMAKRFMVLLEADREELFDRVIRIVAYAKAQGIPIPYARLEQDLRSWPGAREAWAKAFWAPGMASDSGNDAENPQPNEATP